MVFDFDIDKIEYVVKRKYSYKDRYSISNDYSFRILYVTSGEAVFRFEKSVYTLKAGDLVLLKPGNNYIAEVLSQEDYNFFTISFIAKKDFINDKKPIICIQNQNLLSDFNLAYDMFEFQHELFLLKTKALIYNCVYNVIAQNGNEKTSYDEMDKAIHFIKSNYMNKISLAQIADVAGCSISHFKFRFYKKTKTSPMKFLNEFRINRAEDLLKSGLYNVSETANLCGFSNVHYFSNAFKKFTGLSPKTYFLTKNTNKD